MSKKELEEALCKTRKPVIVGVKLHTDKEEPGDFVSGHYVLVTGRVGNDFIIKDPGSKAKNRLSDYEDILGDTFEHNDKTRIFAETLDEDGNRILFSSRGYVKNLNEEMLKAQFDSLTVTNTFGSGAFLGIMVSDADLLVIDSQGRRTGMDPETGRWVEEIPSSQYVVDSIVDDETNESSDDWAATVNIADLPEGGYRIIVTSTASSSVSLAVSSYANDGSSQTEFIDTAEMGENEQISYLVDFRQAPGESTNVTEIVPEIPPPPPEPNPPLVSFSHKGWSGDVQPSGPYIGLSMTGPEDQANVQFRSLGIDPNGGSTTAWTWTWYFGDGSSPVETGQLANWPLGVSVADHEFSAPGEYEVTVVFNNGIEDSKPASTTVNILPALDRDTGRFYLETCYAEDHRVRAMGRLFHESRDTHLQLSDFWEGGLDLGRQSLDEWLDQSFYFVITTPRYDHFIVLGEINVQLPNLSFNDEFELPDLTDGEYIAYVVPGDWIGVDFEGKDFPLHLNYFPAEVGIFGASTPFSVPCQASTNLPPFGDAGGPYKAVVDVPIRLNGTASYDPDGDDSSLKFKWYGPFRPIEEGPLEGPNPQAVFRVPGTYIVSLVVEDELGAVTYPTDETQNSVTTVTVYDTCNTNQVPGDLDSDCDVDFDDRAILFASLRHCTGDSNYNPDADYDVDSCITFNDYRIWFGYYQDAQ
jgi:hypothetical protein